MEHDDEFAPPAVPRFEWALDGLTQARGCGHAVEFHKGCRSRNDVPSHEWTALDVRKRWGPLPEAPRQPSSSGR